MGLLEPWHIIVILIVFGCIFGIPSAIIGSYKKIGAFNGFLLGLFLNIIGLIIVICQSPKNANKPIVLNESIPDQLKKYKDLLDSGALTQEEFERQKAGILA